jgi:hypothetical protein
MARGSLKIIRAKISSEQISVSWLYFGVAGSLRLVLRGAGQLVVRHGVKQVMELRVPAPRSTRASVAARRLERAGAQEQIIATWSARGHRKRQRNS